MSTQKLRIDASGINGLWPILPTPAKEGASDWRQRNTVDLDETARTVEALIASGVDGLISLGTYGEAHSLLWEEKKAFVSCVVETIRGRIPFFAGSTALNTREVIEQTRVMHDLGASGTMLGVPMWCKADLATAVQFYKDVTEACPDTAIAIYANSEAFKFEFSRPFWAQVGKLPRPEAGTQHPLPAQRSRLLRGRTHRSRAHDGVLVQQRAVRSAAGAVAARHRPRRQEQR